jgi:hypothetical protein
MARIRTIKPEFPQSESMGRVSRDARLCFVQTWTIADDSGRLRGNSRMLASLLFPYDDDAPGLIDGWLEELEVGGCIVRYEAEGSTYIQIAKWLSHQKIDKPSPSKIPEFDESSRVLASVRKSSPLDQGSRTKDQGKDRGSLSTLSGACPQNFADAETNAAPEPYKLPNCPHAELVEAYHAALPTLPRCEVLNDTRRGFMQARWREVCTELRLDKPAGLEWFRGYFASVAKSKFLTGRVATGRDRRAFRADLEWLTRPNNFAKVVEGRYLEAAA